jgi:hypothetical protein
MEHLLDNGLRTRDISDEDILNQIFQAVKVERRSLVDLLILLGETLRRFASQGSFCRFRARN